MNQQDLLIDFIGVKFNKIINQKFSFPAFFFGGLYYIYRKMYLLGFMFYLLTTLIVSLVPNTYIVILIHFLLSIIFAIIFRPTYIKFCINKTNKIFKQNPNDEDIIFIKCISKGKPAILPVIVAIILSAVCLGFIYSKLEISNNSSDNSSNSTNEYNSDNNTSNEASEHIGNLEINGSINLDEKVNIQLPNGFLKKFYSSSSYYFYEYDTGGTGIFNECTLSLYVVKWPHGSKKLIIGLAQEDSATSTIKSEIINNMEWWSYLTVDGFGNTYEASTTHNENVYLLKYSIGKHVNGDISEYTKYYNDILHSITFN